MLAAPEKRARYFMFVGAPTRLSRALSLHTPVRHPLACITGAPLVARANKMGPAKSCELLAPPPKSMNRDGAPVRLFSMNALDFHRSRRKTIRPICEKATVFTERLRDVLTEPALYFPDAFN